MLEIKLLGAVSVLDRSRATIEIAGRKDRALIAYLATHLGRPVARDRLVELIWPNSIDGAGRASLRQSLSTIRKALPNEATQSISASRDSVCMDTAVVTTDVQQLEAAQSDPARLTELHLSFDGVALQGLGNISAEFDNWVASETARIGSMALEVLSQAAERAEKENRFNQAISYLTQALVIDPLSEDAVRRLMRMQAATGRPEAALRQYRSLEVMMETELGVRPDASTQEVARSIRIARRQSSQPATQLAQQAKSVIPGSVLVTRFVERSDAEDYFAMTLTESVILALARFQETPVMDLKTVKAAGDLHGEDATEMAGAVGAEFVLSGAVQRGNEKLRINARLTKADTGRTVWADKFDTVLADILDIEDELSARVATAIAGHIEDEALRRARGKSATGLEAIDLVMRGRYYLNLYTRSGEKEARQCFEQALKLEPDCVPALAGLAVSHLHDFESAEDLSGDKLELAQDLARKAIDLDENNAHARYAMASSLCYLGGHDLALRHCNRALEINPNDYHNICTLGWILTFSGRIEEGIACNARAIRLNPYAPNGCLMTSGFGLLVRGEYEEAIGKLSAIDSENMFKQGALAACYNRLGLEKEAELAAKAFFALAEQDFPGDGSQDFSRTREYWRSLFRFAEDQDADSFFGALNEVGLPV